MSEHGGIEAVRLRWWVVDEASHKGMVKVARREPVSTAVGEDPDRRYIVTTDAVEMHVATWDEGRVPAVLARIGKGALLVGEAVPNATDSFLGPVPESLGVRLPKSLRFEPQVGFVALAGTEDYHVSIGTVRPEGGVRDFRPLPTRNLGHVATTPAGLQVVLMEPAGVNPVSGGTT